MTKLRVAICSAKALHKGGPGRKFSPKNGGREINPSFHCLSGNDDDIRGPATPIFPHDLLELSSAVFRAKAAMNQRERRTSRQTLDFPDEGGMEVLCPLYPVKDDQGHMARHMPIKNRISKLADVALNFGFIARRRHI